MLRIASMLLLSCCAQAAPAVVDFESAATLYQAAEVREQVRASLGTMPAHVRRLFAADRAANLSEAQLDAVAAAAVRGFRLDVFEAPALQALAAHLDPVTVAKSHAFLTGALGRRMVAADLALARLGEANIDQIMDGKIAAPSTPARDALVAKIERATHSTETTVNIFLGMGQAVAIGTAIGSGLEPTVVENRAPQAGAAERAGVEENMRVSMRRFIAYGYRDLADADLKRIIDFLETSPGRHYIAAYSAAMLAGFDAMGRRTGEQLGESLRDLARIEAAAQQSSAELAAPPR